MGAFLSAEELIKRFNSRIAKTDNKDDCWIWTGAKKPNIHYPDHVYGNSYHPLTRKVISAHKVAYELAYGSVPEGQVVMHSCDNKLCCNPKHLSVGTHKENTADMIAKGRSKLVHDGSNNRGKKASYETKVKLSAAKKGMSRLPPSHGSLWVTLEEYIEIMGRAPTRRKEGVSRAKY